jgi:hypothetical protein
MTLRLIGCYPLKGTLDLKVHGGNVSSAMKYSIQQHFARAQDAIRLADIAEHAIQNEFTSTGSC